MSTDLEVTRRHLRTVVRASVVAVLVATWLTIGATASFAQAPAQPVQPIDELTGETDPVAPAAPAAAAEPIDVAVDSTFVDPVDSVRVRDLIVTMGDDEQGLSRSVAIVLMSALGAIIPALLLLMTTFTRFVVVLGLMKQALALQSVPPSQVLIGLAFFLTTFVMAPVFETINLTAVQPWLDGDLASMQALSTGFEPLRAFMLAQTRPEDLQMFIDMQLADAPATPQDVAVTTLIPSFVVSELRTSFIIGFVIFVPFLLVDLVVAAVLMSMGMVMVPPVFISLPIKLLLFVLVDGWVLMIGSLVSSVAQVGVT